jgi:hypothetical protein
MNSTDVCRGIGRPNIDFEISHAAQKIVLVDIPLFIVTHVDIGGYDTKADETGCGQDSRNIERLVFDDCQ